MPSGHIIARGGLTWASILVSAVLLFESGAAYVICCMHVLYEHVNYAVTGTCCVTLLCLLNRINVGLLGKAALRTRRAPLWWWAAAASWSGSSWSGGEWSSPGPRRTLWGLTEAWWAPAWRSCCWNAAKKTTFRTWIGIYVILSDGLEQHVLDFRDPRLQLKLFFFGFLSTIVDVQAK